MTACMIIEPGIGEWRSALIDEDGFPTDLQFHAEASISPVDAIYAARVTNVDTTLDMAFLDLGDGLTGALNLRRAKLLVKGAVSGIADCLNEGDLLTVQVVAEPSVLEGKALPVTPRPRLLGRYIVAENGAPRLNFSKDLSANAQKKLSPLLQESTAWGAIIVRSTAQGVDPAVVAAEAEWLVAAVSKTGDTPGLLYQHAPLVQALLAVPGTDDPILIEGGSAFAEAKALAGKHWPALKDRLQAHTSSAPAFETMGVEEAIDEALADRIDLPSGGWISITPTPAFTAIDVNMGRALQGRAAGEAKLITNLEAAMAVAYHLRFQDIGGLVVVDFIDMSARGSARELMQTLDAAFLDDPAPVQHTGISQFGLVEINRRRKGLSLRDRMLEARKPRSRPGSQAIMLLRQARRAALSATPGTLVLKAPDLVWRWLDDHPDLTASLERESGRSVRRETSDTADAFIRS